MFNPATTHFWTRRFKLRFAVFQLTFFKNSIIFFSKSQLFLLQQRLNDSLIKFQEYEAIIESILHNLKEWEPHIAEQLDTSVVSIEDCKKQLDDIKVRVI
jgi:hypothetical protein